MRLQGIRATALGDLDEECDLCLVTKGCKYGAEPHFRQRCLHAYFVSILATSLSHILGPGLLISSGFGFGLSRLDVSLFLFSFLFFPMQSEGGGKMREKPRV